MKVTPSSAVTRCTTSCTRTACRMMMLEMPRRKNGATLKLCPGMITTLLHSSRAMAIAARRSSSTLWMGRNSSTSFAQAWISTKSTRRQPERASCSTTRASCSTTCPMRAPDFATLMTRAFGNAAARRPAVECSGSAPTPNAVLSPAITIVRRQAGGDDWAGMVRATMRREKRMRDTYNAITAAAGSSNTVIRA
jgi:hypothetical protein